MSLIYEAGSNSAVISPAKGNLQYGGAGAPPQRNLVSLDHHRRPFGVSEELIQLMPHESAFFTMLAKLNKKKINTPIWKQNEEREQWQRRNFVVYEANSTGLELKLACDYDQFGKLHKGSNTYQTRFLLHNQILAIENVELGHTGTDPVGTLYCRVGISDSDETLTHTGTEGTDGHTVVDLLPLYVLQNDGTIVEANTPLHVRVAAGARGQVVGTAFPEGSSYPEGWTDELSMCDFYAQIYKSACPMFSGTTMATEYRAKKDEFARKWLKVLKEHKMDINHSVLFGVGGVRAPSGILSTDNNGTQRFSWGLIPYISRFGRVESMSYSSTGYNDFVDFAMDYFRPENGNTENKVWLASHKVIAWFAKLGQGFSFIGNTSGSGAHRYDVMTKPTKFGFNVTEVQTPFGNFKFVPEALLRNQWEDIAVMVDLDNVAWRPLAGNGKSRDTFIRPNVQSPGIDGRVDEIITEAGLEITMPEKHCIFKFGN